MSAPPKHLRTWTEPLAERWRFVGIRTKNSQMNRAFLAPLLILGLASGCATSKPVALTEPTVVETACGECQFHMKGDSCDLAVRILGKGYYVKNVDIDSLGNAHGKDGLCNAIRQARVRGFVEGGKFVAEEFTLLPSAPAR
jgi:hypothetical protein